jgi:hypothetical protein
VLRTSGSVLCLFALWQATGSSQAPGSTQTIAAQIERPRIGSIEFFGLHKTPEAKVRQALGVREGDYLPRSKGDAEERVDALPGIVETHLEAVCCEKGSMILYVGVEERGATHFDFRDQPDGEIQLPEDATKLYRRFLEASERAARFTTAEDLTQGHSLSGDKETRDLQEQFIPVATKYAAELRHVLRDAGDEEQRAMAAYIIGYLPEKKFIVDDLQFALKDPDAGVRNNATRSLKALAVYGRLHENSGVKVEPTWFIEMLNSLSFADRMQALTMLQILTESRDASNIDQMRDRALPSLIEMARWKTLQHALPAFVLVGRMTPLNDTQVQDAWGRGDRESVIAQAQASKKKK